METGLTPGQGAMATQLYPFFLQVLRAIQPILDQPVIRYPWAMPLSSSLVIQPGATVVLTPSDFQYSFEWPFEIREISFSNDPAHTFRDWRVSFMDLTNSQPMQKPQNTMVATLVDTNTSKWVWLDRWVMRPKGGGFQITVENLDTVNPIEVDINLIGAQMIPRT